MLTATHLAADEPAPTMTPEAEPPPAGYENVDPDARSFLDPVKDLWNAVTGAVSTTVKNVQRPSSPSPPWMMFAVIGGVVLVGYLAFSAGKAKR